MTGIVLVVVLITKFLHGAWIAIAAMVVLFLLMKGIHRHYDRVAAELVVDEDEDTDAAVADPRHRAGVEDPQADDARRQRTRARCGRRRSRRSPSTSTRRRPGRCSGSGTAATIPVPLKVLDSPFREMTDPVIDYVRSVRRGSPRDLVTVLIPEYVVGHWWEHLLHNQSALRLKGRLLFTPGVMVTSVPVAARARRRRWPDRLEGSAPGAVRRGDSAAAGGLS